MQLFGIKLLGVDLTNARKLLFTLIFFALLYGISEGLRANFYTTYNIERHRITFWTRQGISLPCFLLGVLGFISIWFDNPARLATAKS